MQRVCRVARSRAIAPGHAPQDDRSHVPSRFEPRPRDARCCEAARLGSWAAEDILGLASSVIASRATRIRAQHEHGAGR